MFKLLHKSLNKVALLYCYNHLLDPHMLCVNQDIIMNLLFRFERSFVGRWVVGKSM